MTLTALPLPTTMIPLLLSASTFAFCWVAVVAVADVAVAVAADGVLAGFEAVAAAAALALPAALVLALPVLPVFVSVFVFFALFFFLPVVFPFVLHLQSFLPSMHSCKRCFATFKESVNALFFVSSAPSSWTSAPLSAVNLLFSSDNVLMVCWLLSCAMPCPMVPATNKASAAAGITAYSHEFFDFVLVVAIITSFFNGFVLYTV